MRGFAAALVAALFAVAVLKALAVLRVSQAGSFEAEQAGLKVVKLGSVESDFRTSLAMVLRKAWREGQSTEQKIRAVAERLAGWEEEIEEEYASRGVLVDVWWGQVNDREKARLQQKMIEEKATAKCGFCTDFSEKLEDWQGEEVFSAVGVLVESDKHVVVSNSGSGRLKNSAANALGGFTIGCSVYMPGEKLAAVFLYGAPGS